MAISRFKVKQCENGRGRGEAVSASLCVKVRGIETCECVNVSVGRDEQVLLIRG